jgi:hypothetical protein
MLESLLFIAAATAAMDQPIVVEAPAVEAKKVCRTERSTGSRVVKQVCKSAAEMAKDELDSKNKLRLGNQGNRPPDAFKGPTGN